MSGLFTNCEQGKSFFLIAADTENMHEFYEERAAILQFEAGLPKEKAEALAAAELKTWMESKK